MSAYLQLPLTLSITLLLNISVGIGQTQLFFKGLIGNRYPITLELSEKEGLLTGFYYYDKYAKKIPLSIEVKDSLLYGTEPIGSDLVKKQLQINRSNDSLWTGIWTDSKKKLPLYLYRTTSRQNTPLPLHIRYLKATTPQLTLNNFKIDQTALDSIAFKYLPQKSAHVLFSNQIPKKKRTEAIYIAPQKYKRSKRHLTLGKCHIQYKEWIAFFVQHSTHKGHDESSSLYLATFSIDGTLLDWVKIQGKSIEERTGSFIAQEWNSLFPNKNSFFLNHQTLDIKYNDTFSDHAFYKETPSQKLTYYTISAKGYFIETPISANDNNYKQALQKLTIVR